jgi:hypothetical protein
MTFSEKSATFRGRAGICISFVTLLEYSAHTHLTDDPRKGSMNGCGTWVLAAWMLANAMFRVR